MNNVRMEFRLTFGVNIDMDFSEPPPKQNRPDS